MAQYGELKFDELVGGTLDTLSRNIRPAVLFFVVLTAVGSAIQLVGFDFIRGLSEQFDVLSALQSVAGLGVGIGGVLVFVIGVVGQYLLWETMLRRLDFAPEPRRHRYFAFFGQSILIALGVAFGYVLLIIPGLIFMARWSLAPALLIRDGQGVFEAMGKSWNAVKGNTTPIVLVLIVARLVLMVISLMVGGTSVLTKSDVGNGVLAVVGSQVISTLGVLLSIGMGVFLYGRLYNQSRSIAETFA